MKCQTVKPPLTAERLRELLEYRPAEGVFVWRLPAHNQRDRVGTVAGYDHPTSSGKTYREIGLNGRAYKCSRLAWLYMTGEWPADQIDHINGNSLDDRWVNLREATPLQNARNIKSRKRNSDLPMGVRVVKGRFQARTVVNKKIVHLGGFSTPEEASAEYQEARRRYYGEFA
jgi:hypothetical protein